MSQYESFMPDISGYIWKGLITIESSSFIKQVNAEFHYYRGQQFIKQLNTEFNY